MFPNNSVRRIIMNKPNPISGSKAQMGSLFILSGPSGAGKSSLVDATINRLKPKHAIDRFLTYTSRAPRAGEVHGKDFYFVTQDAFESKMDAGEFLEVSDALGTYYGTAQEVKDCLLRGQSGFLVIDRPGAARLKDLVSEVFLIWVTVPSLEILEERLRRRGTETEDQIKRRLHRAAQEIADEAASNQYNCHIENSNFDTAVQKLCQIVEQKLALKK